MKFLKTVAGAAVSSLWEKVSGNVVTKDTSANVGIGGASTITAAFQIGDTAEDYFLQLEKNQLKFNRGGASYIDQSVAGGSLYFRTTASNAGDTNTMIIASDGAITKPVQPAFCAVKTSSANQDNIATATSVTVTFDSERFDQGGDFASNTFTAPVTGRYQLSWLVRLDNIDTAAGYYQLYLKTSNINYAGAILDPDAFDADVPYYHLQGAVLCDMDASDTAYLIVFQSSGTAQTDIRVDNTGDTWFSGFLAC